MHNILDNNFNIQLLLDEQILKNGLSKGECKAISNVATFVTMRYILYLFKNIDEFIEKKVKMWYSKTRKIKYNRYDGKWNYE